MFGIHKKSEMKTLIFVPWYDLKSQSKLSGVDLQYPSHHLWGYDAVPNAISLGGKSGIWKKIERIMRATCLWEQLWALMNQKKYDQIFLPVANSGGFLALFRMLGLLRRRLVGISHFSMTAKRRSFLGRFESAIRRWVVLKGYDDLLFLNQRIHDIAVESGAKRVGYIRSWGVDVAYYESISNVAHNVVVKSYFCTGKTNRDFDVIIRAFSKITQSLIIQTNRLGIVLETVPPNVMIDSRSNLRDTDLVYSYAQAKAVLVPLREVEDFPTGITVIFEAFCMGKAVIVTRNSHFPIDIEKEGVGLVVEYGDVDGWVNAVLWMERNPEEVREMGRKGKVLVETRYNYKMYCSEVVALLDRPR